MADVVAALLQGVLSFCEARAVSLTTATFKDAEALANSLSVGAPAPIATRLKKFAADAAANVPAVQPAVSAVQPHATAASQAVTQMAAELATAPFSLATAKAAATQLATVAAELEAAIAIIALAVGADIEAQVNALAGPWVAPFQGLGGAGQGFDTFAQQLLGVPNAASQFESLFARDAAKKEISFQVAAAGGEHTPVPAFPALTLEQASLTAFLDYGNPASVGVRAAAVINTGLRNDGLLEQILPSSTPKARAASTIVQLDTANGLSLGAGQSPRLTLPFDFSLPGIELHDISLAVSAPESGDGHIELTTTIAGKLGGVMSVVVDGGGVNIGLAPPGAALPVTLSPRFPDSAGVTVDAGVIRGGGYLSHTGNEYGGALDLRLGTIAITAIGFISTSPFSLVLVIGVQFAPAIELSFGFTLDGVGGLLALERRIDSDALRHAIIGHSADTILFPEDPVANAPTILATLHDIFPYQSGGFVVGPIAELGWGSQARLVTAKLGIALSLPDPKLVILGSLRVAVPSVDAPRELCTVDLNAELFGEITTEYMSLVVGLTDSKVAEITISGDVGFLVAWGGSPDVAISIGGFHPHYTPPAQLTGLRRIAFDLTPYPFVTLHAEGYFAITTNTVQFGVQVRLIADIGIASAEAWLGLDALFRWAPTFHFEVDISAGLALKVLGHTFAGVDFSGHLEGVTPWMLAGSATLDVWFLPTVHFDIGPVTWGQNNPQVPDAVSPAEIVAAALMSADAWRPQLPSGFDMVVRLTADVGTPLLVHPLGALEVKQIKVPLEIVIDRVGANPVTAHRVNLGNPRVGAQPAGAVSHVTEHFAPADFLTLTDDQRLSRQAFEEFPAGARVVATGGPTLGPPVDALYEWETIFPHEPALASKKYGQKYRGVASSVLQSGAVARAARVRLNPYLNTPDPVELMNPGQVQVRERTDLAGVAGAQGFMTTTAASRAIDTLVRAGADAGSLQLVSAGVAE